MKVIDPKKVAKDTSPRPIFTGGSVGIQSLIDKSLTENLRILHVHFSPGSRTKLHTHTGDQVLIVTEGKGILATEARENLVTPGMIVHVPPGEKHWHGAAKDSSFSHISVTPPSETTIVE